MDRIKASTTTAAQYRLAVSHFAKHPEPPGTLLTWLCRGNIDYLDLQHDRLVINPA